MTFVVESAAVNLASVGQVAGVVSAAGYLSYAIGVVSQSDDYRPIFFRTEEADAKLPHVVFTASENLAVFAEEAGMVGAS